MSALTKQNGKPSALDCSREPVPRCPHCGQPDRDTGDLWSRYFSRDGDVRDSECGVCEKLYEVVLHVDYAYTTRPAQPVEPAQGAAPNPAKPKRKRAAKKAGPK